MVLAAAGVAAAMSAGTAAPAVAAPAGPGVFGFGSNASGELGDGTTTASYTPVAASGLPGPARQVAAGYLTSLALLSDGTVWAWGCNGFGQLGTGSSGQFNVPPGPVRALAGVSQIAFGGGYEGGYALVVGSQAYATVPSVKGQTTAVAGQHLQAADLVLGTVTPVTDNTCNSIGKVISQTPAAGTVVTGGTAVSVTIGQRPCHPCP